MDIEAEAKPTLVAGTADGELQTLDEKLARSAQLHERARRVFPSGVNSGIRAGERPFPLTFSHGRGVHLFDVDGNGYIDFQLGQGALFLAHAHPGLVDALSRQLQSGAHFAGQSEIELAAGERLVTAMPSLEQVRFTNSATEAVLAVLRLARAATGRARFIRFEGHYHGWSDEGLAGFAPSEEDRLTAHRSRPSHPSAGVLREAVEQFDVIPFNDVEGLMGAVTDDVAAVIFEPVMCNTGCIPPTEEFVAALVEARDEHGCLLIADETITGLRFGLKGAQARFGIPADLTILGKAIGGGVPVAAFGGRADLMELIATGVVGHAGTLNGNPLCMAAVDYVMTHVSEEHIAQAEEGAVSLAGNLRRTAGESRLPLLVQQVGPVIYTAVTELDGVRDFRDVSDACDTQRWAQIRLELLAEGVRVLDRGLWYLSPMHTEEDLAAAAEAFAGALSRV